LPWFERSARALPWRTRRTAYRVVVSEFMLQQTRVDQARPYFLAFVRRFPGWRRLAAAAPQDVLKAWEGLGYYARARNLQRLARSVVRDHGGRLPASAASLAALPGIGPYTAAAVESLARNRPAAVVDGNVARVFSRLLAVRLDPRRAADRERVRRRSMSLLPAGRSRAYNESLMELGALVCTPRSPRCGDCPLRAVCRAGRAGRAEEFPGRRPARARPVKTVGAAVVLDARGRVLIARRREGDRLGGLWEFPGGKRERGEDLAACIRREMREELGIGVEVGRRLIRVDHDYSHFSIRLHAHWCRHVSGRPRAIECAGFAWVSPPRLRRYPFSRADLHVLDALEAALRADRAGGVRRRPGGGRHPASSTDQGRPRRGPATAGSASRLRRTTRSAARGTGSGGAPSR
jgi:A/G-specific adenine glycosylase